MEMGTLSNSRLVIDVLAISLLLASASASASAQLMVGFYSLSCPAAEIVVRNTVGSATSSDPSVPGKLLRLVFHDCFVEVSIMTCFELLSDVHRPSKLRKIKGQKVAIVENRTMDL